MLDLGEARLRGDVAHRAALRAGAEQGSLRTAQHFDAIEVEELDQRIVGIESERAHLDRRIVDVDSGGARAAARGDAANRDLVGRPESIATPGVKRTTSEKSLMPFWSMASWVMAVTLIGTRLMLSSWRVAVTTISSRAPVVVSAAPALRAHRRAPSPARRRQGRGKERPWV